MRNRKVEILGYCRVLYSGPFTSVHIPQFKVGGVDKVQNLKMWQESNVGAWAAAAAWHELADPDGLVIALCQSSPHSREKFRNILQCLL